MMKCNNVHSTLEKMFVPPLNSSSDYIAQMRLTRLKQPHNICVLDYFFFKNFENVSVNVSSLRPEEK